MKQAAMIVILVAANFVRAQQPANQQSQPAGQSGVNQQATAPSGTAAQGQAPQAHMPQAKTQPEFDAYNAAVANQKDPETMEKSADDFAAKFPNSELRALLYKATMRGFQNANNGDKMLETAQKLLKVDPNDPEGLLAVAEVTTERTRDSDLDKEQRYAQAQKDAEHALQSIDSGPLTGVPPDKVEAYKGLLRSSVYSVMGTINSNQEKYADAENYFRKSIDAFPSQPDPVVVLRLAVALDKQGKYADALKEANHAVELTQENTTAGTLARRERDRLVQLTGGIPMGSTPAPAPASKSPGVNTPPPTNPH